MMEKVEFSHGPNTFPEQYKRRSLIYKKKNGKILHRERERERERERTMKTTHPLSSTCSSNRTIRTTYEN